MTSEELKQRITDAVAAYDAMTPKQRKEAMNAGVLDRRYVLCRYCESCGNKVNREEGEDKFCTSCDRILWAVEELNDTAKRAALHKVIAYIAKGVDD